MVRNEEWMLKFVVSEFEMDDTKASYVKCVARGRANEFCWEDAPLKILPGGGRYGGRKIVS